MSWSSYVLSANAHCLQFFICFYILYFEDQEFLPEKAYEAIAKVLRILQMPSESTYFITIAACGFNDWSYTLLMSDVNAKDLDEWIPLLKVKLWQFYKKLVLEN